MKSSSEFWEKYYTSHRKSEKCSFFAEFVLPFLHQGKQLIDLGCGNARDSIFFARKGINVLAIDQCKNELQFLKNEFSDFDSFKFSLRGYDSIT